MEGVAWMMASEKRLIDAEELWKKFESEPWYDNADRDEIALPMVDDAPTVDAVEVVRCKDCKHYDNTEGICWCKLNSKFYPGGFDWHSFPEDGFCSYGERKDNG
jgi:hypothetical protein